MCRISPQSHCQQRNQCAPRSPGQARCRFQGVNHPIPHHSGGAIRSENLDYGMIVADQNYTLISVVFFGGSWTKNRLSILQYYGLGSGVRHGETRDKDYRIRELSPPSKGGSGTSINLLQHFVQGAQYTQTRAFESPLAAAFWLSRP